MSVSDDISTRDVPSTPYVDLYLFGAPCVSFSSLGKNRGTRDPRGQLAEHSLNYIDCHRPRLVIMEPCRARIHVSLIVWKRGPGSVWASNDETLTFVVPFPPQKFNCESTPEFDWSVSLSLVARPMAVCGLPNVLWLAQ